MADERKVIRKTVCIQYPTGKVTTARNGKQYPETKLLTVGSAFVDEESGRIKGLFRAVPPQWDGKFLLLDPLPRNGDATTHTEEVQPPPTDDDVPF